MSALGERGRLDKWLWSVRVFKTRALATEACRAGNIDVNGLAAKPARDAHVQDTVAVRQGIIVRTLRVLGVPAARVGAKLVPAFCEELTPASEFEKARIHRLQQVQGRDKGSGRPTKRDRRLIERFFG